MNRLGPWTVAYTHIVLLILICSPLTEGIAFFRLRRNSTLVSSSSVALSPQASVGVVRRLPSPVGRVGKLGRVRQRSTSTTTTTTETLPTTEIITTTTEETPTFTYNVSVSEEDDLRRGQGDDALSVVWPVRARPAKRFRIHTPTTAEPQPLLKLLQPKPTRPAIYSLDGFVPRPSIQRVVATEPPPHLNALAAPFPFGRVAPYSRRKASRRKHGDGDEEEGDLGYELQSLGGRRRRKKISSYTAFARKGVPGQDFPVYTYIPHTDFDCGPTPGLYADPYTDCQVWHMCPGGNLSPRHSFLCPNGTIFNQKKRICDWWYNVDCRRDV